MSITNLKYKDCYFDSDEEVFVSMWFEELKKAGYVSNWEKTIRPIPLTKGFKVPYKKITQLKTKVKIENKEKVLLNPSEYTPDFYVWFTQKGFNLFGSFTCIANFNPNALFFANNDGIPHPELVKFVFEVKPSFDQNNMERLFKNNQKFIFDKYEMFVNLIEPIELFKKTFVPLDAMSYLVYRKKPTSAKNKHKNIGDFKYDFQPKTLNDFLCLSKND